MTLAGSGQHFPTAIANANSLQQQLGAAVGLVKMQHCNSLGPSPVLNAPPPGHGPTNTGSLGSLHGQPSGQLPGPSPGLDRMSSLQQHPSGGVASFAGDSARASSLQGQPSGQIDRMSSLQQHPSGGVPSFHGEDARAASLVSLHGQPSGQVDRMSILQQQPSGGMTSLHHQPSEAARVGSLGSVHGQPSARVDRRATLQQQPSAGMTSLHHYHSDSVLEHREVGLHTFNSSRCSAPSMHRPHVLKSCTPLCSSSAGSRSSTPLLCCTWNGCSVRNAVEVGCVCCEGGIYLIRFILFAAWWSTTCPLPCSSS